MFVIRCYLWLLTVPFWIPTETMSMTCILNDPLVESECDEQASYSLLAAMVNESAHIFAITSQYWPAIRCMSDGLGHRQVSEKLISVWIREAVQYQKV